MAAIGAGDRNVRVRFEVATRDEDDYGSANDVSWAVLATAWAMVRYGNSAERREAAQSAASQSATITVLSNSKTRELTSKNRAVIGGAVWDIVGVIPTPDRSHIAVTATRGQD